MRRGDERLREEIESHIAIQTEENIRAGMTPEEARRQARLKFGGVEVIREQFHARAGDSAAPRKPSLRTFATLCVSCANRLALR